VSGCLHCCVESHFFDEEFPMPYTNAVIDISHYQPNTNFANAQQAGILGVIHKATQGTTLVDQTYQNHLTEVQQLGLLWGAYHFGSVGAGADQADFFLQTVKPQTSTLLVLDFESSAMSLQDARDFVTHIQSVTGIWPGLYGGAYLIQQLGGQPDAVLQNCWLWLAQYVQTPKLPPGWNQWTLWQYTDGSAVPDPNPIEGVTPCDRDYYCDTADTLQAKWATGSLA
jgi:lysozyme